MPIYEYRCGGCHRRVSLFFPSIATAEQRTAAGENRCPRCESADLTRLMSRARVVRGGSGSSSSSDDDFGDFEDDGGGGGGAGDFMGGMDDLGMPDDEDPRAIARWARQMKEQFGPEMDLGPEYDRALARIEAGEDPDKVMDDLDPEAMDGGGSSGDEDESFDDFDEG